MEIFLLNPQLGGFGGKAPQENFGILMIEMISHAFFNSKSKIFTSTEDIFPKNIFAFVIKNMCHCKLKLFHSNQTKKIKKIKIVVHRAKW